MSEPIKDELKEIIEQVTNDYNEYEHQREVCLSFREQYSNSSASIKVWSEPAITPPSGNPKTPDLLMAQTDWLILDYKEITSKRKRTLEGHIKDMSGYNQTFTIGNGKTTFTPDVGMICPANVAPTFKEIVNTLPVLGSRLGKNIRLKLTAGKFKSREFGNMFLEDTEVSFPLTPKASVQKFLRHEPKSDAYIAEIVWAALWQLNPRLGSDEILATKSDLLNILSVNYPPYLKSMKGDSFDIPQATERKLNRALQFLKDIDFIKIRHEQKNGNDEVIISTSRNKGKTITNYKEYFIKREAELRFEDLEKARRKEEKNAKKEEEKRQKEAAKKPGQQDLSQWFT